MSRELAFIEALRRMATHPAARHFDDDCAVVELGGEALVLTHDMMAEGVHYLPDQDPADVAWKLVTVNISDLVAKGAEPMGVLLGYMFGKDDLRFIEGLEEALTYYNVPLLGGDTVSGKGAQALGLTAIGKATHRPVPSRGGAAPDDIVYVTGPVGAAMMGYEALQSGSGDSEAYRRPRALVAQGQALAPHVTAMMDISDGVLLDACRMARASGVTFEMDASAVPIAAPEEKRAAALRWGDDYQLLFTAPTGRKLPVPATAIGRAVSSGETPLMLDGIPLSEKDELGYQHR
ncbi:MAG: thiamine-phosphate kinase [Novosphingobium sp.]|nr:thiamine-phosphate kinase [Novosphingobium sp.]MCB2080336.1 thiamine-phosphate kinase [Novosphingobium sp.]